MVVEPPAAIPGRFVSLPGLEPVVAMEHTDAPSIWRARVRLRSTQCFTISARTLSSSECCSLPIGHLRS
jgi:hypothetical protein